MKIQYVLMVYVKSVADDIREIDGKIFVYNELMSVLQRLVIVTIK